MSARSTARTRSRVGLKLLALMISCALFAHGAAHAQTDPGAPSPQQQPPAARATGVDEHLGDQLPLDLAFTDAQGKPVRLSDYVRGDIPVLLVLAYARCAMLCSLVLRRVSESMARLEHLLPGRDYRAVLVSIDPRERPDEAAQKQAALLERIGFGGEPARLPYLVGEPANVKRLADTLGFRYAWDARSEQYAHPAVVFVLAPDGRIARYLYGIESGPDELAGALEQAQTGAIAMSGLVSDLLRCFRFDPASRRYGEQIRSYFRIGAFAVFGLLSSLVVGLFVWERRRHT